MNLYVGISFRDMFSEVTAARSPNTRNQHACWLPVLAHAAPIELMRTVS